MNEKTALKKYHLFVRMAKEQQERANHLRQHGFVAASVSYQVAATTYEEQAQLIKEVYRLDV